MHDTIEKEVKIAIEAIDTSLEQLTVLLRLQQISLESNNLSPTAQKLLDITVPSITTYCVDSSAVIAIEDIDGIALEGFSSAILTIWNNIVKAFKWIWDKITWLFRSTTTEKEIKDIKADKNKVEDIVEKAATNNKFDEAAYIDRGDILDAFKYLNDSSIDDDIILGKATALVAEMEKIKTLFQYYGEFSTQCQMGLYRYEEMADQASAFNDFYQTVKMYSDRMLDDYIKTNFSAIEVINQEALKDQQIDPNIVIRDDCREIGNLLMNNRVYFIAIKEIQEHEFTYSFNYYHVSIILDEHLKAHHNKVSFLKSSTLNSYQIEVDRIFNTYQKLEEDAAKYAKVVERNFQSGLDTASRMLSKAIRKHEKDNPAEAAETARMLVTLGQSLLKVSNDSAAALSSITRIFKRNAIIHKTLLETNIQYYQS